MLGRLIIHHLFANFLYFVCQNYKKSVVISEEIDPFWEHCAQYIVTWKITVWWGHLFNINLLITIKASLTATTVVQEEEQLSWLLGTPSGPKISVDRFFWPVMNSSMRLKNGWMGSQKYFILLLMKTPRSLQTVHWQRRWVCWKIKICPFVYLLFKWVRLKTFWPPLVVELIHTFSRLPINF